MSLSLPKYLDELRTQPVSSYLSGLVDAPAESPVGKIVGLLRERGTYEVFLPETTRCGMISARDLLRATKAEGSKPSALMVYVPTLSKDSSIGEAAKLMADYRIRAVPISDGRRLIGQVSCVAILKGMNGKIGEELRITSIATKDPITVDEEASIAKARELMVRKRIDHLPVTKNQRLAGMVTSTHLISHLAPHERVGSKSMSPETRRAFDFPVRDVMDENPLTCSADTPTERALELMLRGDKTYILVTQWEELQAIATYRDFMTLVAGPEPESEVPIFMVGLPDDPFEAEATKAKFRRTVSQIRRAFPDIVEARSVIKSKTSARGKERRRYEVNVQIRTTRDSYTYSEEGWELPEVYDIITDRMKRLITQKLKVRRPRVGKGAEAL